MKVHTLPWCDCGDVLGQEASPAWSCGLAQPGPKLPRDNRAGMGTHLRYSLSYTKSQRSMCPSSKLSLVTYRAPT